ncbi:helix-turn-helix domain-containing protein [Bradyrhizobium pachyrhizi]
MLVAQHGSLRRAAESADVSQSTLSRRVQSL